MSPTAPARRTPSLWTLIVACGVIVGLTLGLRQATSLYMPHVTRALGTGVEPFSTAMAVANLIWGAVGIAAGAAADRYGAGRVAVAGICLMMLGYFLMQAASSAGDLMWSGVCIGVGAGSCGIGVMVGAIGRAAAPDDRTAAIAALGVAGGIGNFVIYPYTHLFIEVLGWKGSVLVMVATLGAALPLAFVIAAKDQRAIGQEKPQPFKAAAREAFGLRSYWLLIAGFFVCGFQVAFYAAHLPAYAASLGMAGWVAAAALTAVGAANIVGTYLAGRSTRHMQRRHALALIYLGRGAVFGGFLLLPMNDPTLVVLSALLGLFWLATVPLTSGLVATFFGATWLATLYAVVFFAHQAGAFLGVWMAGVLFDATGSYAAMWWISIALGLAAALAHWPIREEPVPRLRAQEASHA
ncbi:MAG: MFS transporter [Rhodospirillales bacterium]|nr:MAG: MFS transporter [Rhodospirillales bacterium]